MGLLRSLAMLFLLVWWSLHVRAQSSNSARALDRILQDYAFRAFVNPKTGIPYNGVVPSYLTGIKITSMRLRSGSLRRRGVPMFNEFEIPIGVSELENVERVVLVYQNLGNRSTIYYPLPGYTYLTSVLGLLAYNAANLSAINLRELDIEALGLLPIRIRFPEVNPVPDGSTAKCLWYDLHGLANFTDVLSGNVCLTREQGHFSIVVENVAPSPAPGGALTPKGRSKNESDSRVGIIVGSAIGGAVLLALMAFLLLWIRKYKRKKRLERMENAAEAGEYLGVTRIGDTKAPSAMQTRTQPTIESEYMP